MNHANHSTTLLEDFFNDADGEKEDPTVSPRVECRRKIRVEMSFLETSLRNLLEISTSAQSLDAKVSSLADQVKDKLDSLKASEIALEMDERNSETETQLLLLLQNLSKCQKFVVEVYEAENLMIKIQRHLNDIKVR